MTELELIELIKLEEDTLCSLPFESQYKMRREELTRLANAHRAMLADIVCSHGFAGQGEANSHGHASSRPSMVNDRDEVMLVDVSCFDWPAPTALERAPIPATK